MQHIDDCVSHRETDAYSMAVRLSVGRLLCTDLKKSLILIREEPECFIVSLSLVNNLQSNYNALSLFPANVAGTSGFRPHEFDICL